MKLCLDLCCGLGGFSRAFKDDSDWEVVTLDIESKFNPTICADVRNITFQKIIRHEGYRTNFVLQEGPLVWQQVVILASPPCERFSLANRTFPKKGIRQAFEVVGQCCEIIAEAREIVGKERLFYALENPKGRLRWFLGKPDLSIHLCDYGGKYLKPTDLWTNIELPMVDSQKLYERSWSSTKNGNKGSTGLLRLRDPAKRALMPYGLSKAVKEAVEV